MLLKSALVKLSLNTAYGVLCDMYVIMEPVSPQVLSSIQQPSGLILDPSGLYKIRTSWIGQWIPHFFVLKQTSWGNCLSLH